MGIGIDFERLELREVLELAIGIEEDEQLRYRELATVVADPRVAAFFRELCDTERAHRRRLESLRDVLFRHATPRFDASIDDEDDEASEPAPSALAALHESARHERSASEFYARAARHVQHAEIRHVFAECGRHAEDHHRAVLRRIEQLAAGCGE